MSDKKEPIIDADKVDEINPSTAQADEKNEQKPKKKSHVKRYIFFILSLSAAAWAFWIFSSESQNIPQPWNAQTHTSEATTMETQITSTKSPVVVTPVTQNTHEAEVIQEKEKEILPLFESVEPPASSKSFDNTKTNQVMPNTAEENELTPSLQALQQQVSDLTRIILTMQQQQLQWSQQQVRAQLFTLLQQAANPQAQLEDLLIAWKSIHFLPLLSQEKHDTAQQAFNSLQDAQQRIQHTTALISQLIQVLASQLHPKAQQEIAQTIADITPIEQPGSFNTWLDWLKQQFVITKLNKHALEQSDDPYADTKQLIHQLNQLKHNISQQSWADMGSLTTILYQLEQHGLDTPFSNESVAQLQQDIEIWQQEAQAWMAQL